MTDQRLSMTIGKPVEIWISLHTSTVDGECMFLFGTRGQAEDYLKYANVQPGFVRGGVWRLERDMEPVFSIEPKPTPADFNS